MPWHDDRGLAAGAFWARLLALWLLPGLWLLPILERRQRIYDARMGDKEAAARLAAIANLPRGWVFEDQRRLRDDLILRASGPRGDELEIAGTTAEEAWRAMAESLAAMGEGRLIR